MKRPSIPGARALGRLPVTTRIALGLSCATAGAWIAALIHAGSAANEGRGLTRGLAALAILLSAGVVAGVLRGGARASRRPLGVAFVLYALTVSLATSLYVQRREGRLVLPELIAPAAVGWLPLLAVDRRVQRELRDAALQRRIRRGDPRRAFDDLLGAAQACVEAARETSEPGDRIALLIVAGGHFREASALLDREREASRAGAPHEGALRSVRAKLDEALGLTRG